MKDNSLDLIVTDPPYGYSFMGKDWDKAVPSIEIWNECLRVLKPGAFMFVMSAPRQDVLSRMIVNIEDAGFRTDFSSLRWIYACVSEDTEILTKNGFKKYNELHRDDMIASLNIETDKLEYVNVQNKFVYDIADELVNITTKNTNQLLTKNHKVLLKKKSNSRYKYKDYSYKEASELLDGVKNPLILLPLARKYEKGNLSIGVEFAELLGWIITEGHICKQTKRLNTWDIRIYQSSVNKDKVDRIRYLLNSLDIKYSEYKRKRKYKNREYIEHCFYINNEWKHKIAKWIPNKKPVNDLLFLNLDELRALFDGMILGDGSTIKGKNNSYAFYQKDNKILDFMQILATHLGFRTSRNEKKQCVNIGWRSNTEIQRKECHISSVKYQGKVWCVQTRNNNFVARRNGSVFITGNSGFPKAMNISKAVDKKMGVKFETSPSNGVGFMNTNVDGYNTTKNQMKRIGKMSNKAKQLDGSYGGFQPKPACEIIIVAMKPLSEKTFTDQALKNGKGVTWLDDCRIPFTTIDDAINVMNGNDEKSNFEGVSTGFKDYKKLHKRGQGNCQGRFPANIIVSDDALNDEINRKSGSNCTRTKEGMFIEHGGLGKGGDEQITYGDCGSFSRFFDLDKWWEERVKDLPKEVQQTFPNILVPKASKSEKNKGCGNLKSKKRADINKMMGDAGTFKTGSGNDRTTKFKNNHPTVKPLKLMSYLITLGSREGDIVYDPFMGSGTTAVAAKQLKRQFIGSEISQEYCEIANARLNKVNVKEGLGHIFG
jgi:site-specific DNA-methyltransferase (adenine-specific)